MRKASLRRLKTDHIDLYQMHHIDRATPWDEIWQAMEQLIREGKITYVGSSNFALYWYGCVAGSEMPAPLPETIIVNDPAAVRNIALLGLGVALLPDVQPDLERGALVRLLPGWYADAGALSLYYASRGLLPAKTRAFADFVVDAFKRQRLAEKFAETWGNFSAQSARCMRRERAILEARSPLMEFATTALHGACSRRRGVTCKQT
jgi:DNA-binding transcriptional LysR family regulator